MRQSEEPLVHDKMRVAQNDIDHLPEGPEGDEMLEKTETINEKLTYSQEYYILNRERLLQDKQNKFEEAKFGDHSARLVKRPKKNFLWGYGTQVHDESQQNGEGCFTKGEIPTIT
jgi:ribosomal silencing factor RsfS